MTSGPSPNLPALLVLLLAGCAGEEPPSAGTGAPPAPEVLAAGPHPGEEILRRERLALEAQAAIEERLARGLARRDRALAAEAFAAGFTGHFPARDALVPIDDGLFEIEQLAAPAQADAAALSGPDFLARLEACLDGWSEVVRASFETDRFEPDADGRSARARAELYLAGELAAGGRADLRALLEARLLDAGAGRWRLAEARALEVTRIASTARPFTDVTRSCGFDFRESETNRRILQDFVDEHQTLALGGLSVVDWNRDGRPDLLATRQGQLSTLFLNDGAGGFVPEPLPIRAPLECPSFFLFLDLDGDGLEELVGSKVLEREGERAFAAIWTRRDGEWVQLERALELPIRRGQRRLAVQTIVPFDADGDGRLDLFFGAYGDGDSRGEHYNTVEAHDGADNHLFLNRGGLVFEEVSDARGIRGTQYTYVAYAFDFDGDGDVDLWEGNDFGPNVLWSNDGAGRFHADAALGFGGVPAYTMGVSLADWENDGRWGFYVANMSAEAGMRIAPLLADLPERMGERVATIASGNMLYVQSAPGEPWQERARELGCAEGEWSWGSVFCDLDSDGDRELVVTNGFASHSDPTLPDWDSHYWNQVAADARFLLAGERSRDVNAEHPFAGSFSGYQRDRCFWNVDGAEGFLDVAWHLGLDFAHDGRAVAPVDVDGDGDLDLALWTLQGLRLLRNEAAPRSFARVALEARGGDRNALGAVVELTAGGRWQRDHLRAVEGFQTQVPLELHFGLGDARAIELLRVRWPSGAVEEWRDLPVGVRIELREGESSARTREVPRWPGAGRFEPEPPALAELGGSAPDEQRALLCVLPTPRGLSAEERAALARLAGELPELELRVLVPRDAARAGDAPQDDAPASEGSTADTPSEDGNAEEARADPAGDEPAVLAVPRARLEAWVGPLGELAAPRALFYDARGELTRAFHGLPRAADLAAILRELDEEAPFPDVSIAAGRLGLAQGRLHEAIAHFEAALASDPSMAHAHEGIGRAHVMMGRTELAEASYARAVEVDADYALGHYNLGVARLRQGRAADALPALEEAVAIAGERAQFLLTLGEARAAAGRGEEALEAFERAARARPEQPEGWLLAGKLLGQLGRYEEARERLGCALAADPQSSEARRALMLVERLLAAPR